jgi:hypothetical protein
VELEMFHPTDGRTELKSHPITSLPAVQTSVRCLCDEVGEKVDPEMPADCLPVAVWPKLHLTI